MNAIFSTQNKRCIWALLACCVLVGVLSLSTLAYRTAQVETDNVLTFGNVKVLLLESVADGEQSASELAIGDGYDSTLCEEKEVSRIARVRNVGSQDAWVRLRPRLSVRNSAGELRPAEVQLRYVRGEDGWAAADDGWWYCEKPLASYQTSTPALTALEFPAGASRQLADGEAYVLTLEVQGVQTKNNGASVAEAAGWPQSEEVAL